LIRLARLGLAALLLVPVLAACAGRASSSSAPSLTTLYASRLALSDITPATGDAQNWWLAAPTFDVRPLNSATRDDAERTALVTRFTHLGTAETLSLRYQVWTSTSIATTVQSYEQTVLGTSLTGPKAGDSSLYYNRKLAGGPSPYNNEAFVRLGQTIITIIWSHADAYASPSTVGKIAVKAAGRLKDGVAGKLRPSPPASVDPLLLAPVGSQLTLLGTTKLPIEVLPQLLGEPNPTVRVDEFRRHGVTDFVYGDYALNNDTRMEVLTAAIAFPAASDGQGWIDSYFAGSLSSTGEFAQYINLIGQYEYGFGGGSRAVLMFCKSSVETEEAARACETPMLLVMGGWHPLLSGG